MIYVVHCKRHKGSVYIGRPSVLGNPYPLKKGEPRGSTLDRYRKYLQKKIAQNDPDIVGELNRLADIAENGDLYLGCWCTPNPCHGDVIREELLKILEARKMVNKTDFILIIAGSRGFENYKLLEKKCDKILQSVSQTRNIIIRSGGAKGADKLGERYAKKRGYTIQEFIPNWRPNGVYDKSAGHKRNREMADGNAQFRDKAHALIAFWDFESTGTKGMIDYATKKGLQVRAINYTQYNGVDPIAPVVPQNKSTSMRLLKQDVFTAYDSGQYDAICILTNGVVKRDGCAVMGAGQAKTALERFNAIDKRLGKKLLATGNHVYKLGKTEKGHVFSFPTKNNYDDNADMDLIVQSAKELLAFVNEHNLKNVLLPRPGCGLGNLKWTDVKKKLTPILDDRFIIVNK